MEHRFFRVGDALRQTYAVRKEGHRFLVRIEGKEVEASTVALGEHRFLLRLPDRQLVVDWARKDKDVFLQLDGQGFRLREEDAAHSVSDGDHGEENEPAMNSPLPGRVVKVLVKPGDEVKKGQPMVIIDSMKIEFEFKAPRPGKVDQVLAVEGKQIDVGQCLIVFKTDAV
jgi:biotin carboxyl carrier protein